MKFVRVPVDVHDDRIDGAITAARLTEQEAENLYEALIDLVLVVDITNGRVFSVNGMMVQHVPPVE